MYVIESLGRHPLPDDLCRASDANVDAILRSAAEHLGWNDVVIERVTSVLGGSCIVCTDVVAYFRGEPLLVARPELYAQ